MGAQSNVVRQEPAALPDFDSVLREAHDGLAQVKPSLPVNFTFTWNGISFAAQVAKSGSGPRIRLAGDLGPVPFSAEAAAQRGRILHLARWRDQYGEDRFCIGPDQHLNLLSDAAVAEPVTGTSIIAAATFLLLRARPYLALASEQRRAAAPPTVMTRPRQPAGPARFSAERRSVDRS